VKKNYIIWNKLGNKKLRIEAKNNTPLMEILGNLFKYSPKQVQYSTNTSKEFPCNLNSILFFEE
jgi:hypothetical protein